MRHDDILWLIAHAARDVCDPRVANETQLAGMTRTDRLHRLNAAVKEGLDAGLWGPVNARAQEELARNDRD